MNSKKVWFVTGASKGLGLTLVKKLLANGYQVAATSRDVKSLSTEVGNKTSSFLPLQMDLVNENSVTAAIKGRPNAYRLSCARCEIAFLSRCLTGQNSKEEDGQNSGPHFYSPSWINKLNRSCGRRQVDSRPSAHGPAQA